MRYCDAPHASSSVARLRAALHDLPCQAAQLVRPAEGVPVVSAVIVWLDILGSLILELVARVSGLTRAGD